jgi:hypothetical protein
MMSTPRLVISIKTELPKAFVATMIVLLVVTAAVAIFAREPILRISAAGAAVGTSLVLVRAVRPRRGELIRLLLDLERRIVYWAHQGQDPEEVHFGSLRAIALEPRCSGRHVNLYAVERTGRWVALGHGGRKELERFAMAMSKAVEVPLWYRTGEEFHNHAEQSVQAEL